MAKPEWGKKRLCNGCGASFYDMCRDPIICPKCGVEHDPAVQHKQRPRVETPPRPPAAAPKAKALAGAGAEAADDDLDDDDTELGGDDVLADDDSEDEEVIEDASELGEDKDDMFEVIDKVEEKDES